MESSSFFKSLFKKKLFNTFVIATLILVIVIMGIGDFFYNKVINRETNQGKSSLYEQIDNKTFNTDRFDKVEKEYFKVKSQYGYNLDGVLIKNSNETQNTVILVHGLAGDKWSMLEQGDIYLDKGFNIFLYDQRHHGMSGGKNISYGFYEKYDLNNVIKFIHKKFPNGIVGVHGESLGASTALLQAGLNQKNNTIKFYVVDCPYSDLYDLLSYRLNKDYNLPNILLVDIASFVTYLRLGFFFHSVSPKKIIKDIEKPVLFIHGEEDDYVPTYMSEEMYKIKPGNKQLYISPGAQHANSFSTNKEEYSKIVNNFIDEVISKN